MSGGSLPSAGSQSGAPARVYRTDAVVLRRHDIGEADRVLTVYTPELGKLRAVAKGARRPKSRLGGHVELFTHVNLLLAQGRTLDIVTQAEMHRPFARLRDDLWKSVHACYVVELVDRFTDERMENAPVFEVLLTALEYLDSLDDEVAAGATQESPDAPEVELAMRSVELLLLGHLGYAPELYTCVQCGTRLVPGSNRFSAAGGGVVCAACGAMHADSQPLSVNAIKAMRLMSREPFGVFRCFRLDTSAAQEIDAALRAHLGHLLERHLRTAAFLDRMKAEERQASRARTGAGARALPLGSRVV